VSVRRTPIALLAACLSLFAVLPAFAQGSTCNEVRAQGATETAIGSCIAASRQSLDLSFSVTCDCPGTGYTVNVFGAPRCNPNEFCPLFIVLVGTAQLDCNFNVISATCGFFPG
jgi:hypothetical protein